MPSARTHPSPRPCPLDASPCSSPRAPWFMEHPVPSPGGLADATLRHPAPILGRFPQEAPRFLPARRASASAQTPNGVPPRTSMPAPVLRPPLLGCALLLAQVSSGTPGLGTPAFSRRSPDASLAAQPSSSGVLRIPHLAGPLVSPCPGPVLRFLRVVSPRPRAVFYLFLFDIFPLGVCGGMFLLVTCKELL